MSKAELYPLKFIPIFKSPLWGGTKLGSVLNKPITGLEICGESWEVSGVKNNISIVSEGDLESRTLVDLIDEYKAELVGKSTYQKYGNSFPLLIKYIDANQDLSIQVHPNDELAAERHDSFGKTEMWYVIAAEKGASLITGFNKATSKEEYLDFFERGHILDLLNKEDVKADDVYYLPAGRVHTIGKGLLIAEIQQTSDITYRIYDFDRVDKDGNKRELHIESAIEAIDYNHYGDYKTRFDQTAQYSTLVKSDYFITNRILTENIHSSDYTGIDSFKILMILDGVGKIETSVGEYTYSTGDTYLIPACINSLAIIPEKESKILEVYLPA